MKRTNTLTAAAAAIIDVIADECGIDYDDTSRDVIRDAIVRQLNAPTDPFELIVDSPRAANWRLKANAAGPGIRLADYHMSTSAHWTAIEDTANRRISDVLAGAGLIPSGTIVGRR